MDLDRLTTHVARRDTYVDNCGREVIELVTVQGVEPRDHQRFIGRTVVDLKIGPDRSQPLLVSCQIPVATLAEAFQVFDQCIREAADAKVDALHAKADAQAQAARAAAEPK